jgi:hypothetical protein
MRICAAMRPATSEPLEPRHHPHQTRIRDAFQPVVLHGDLVPGRDQ